MRRGGARAKKRAAAGRGKKKKEEDVEDASDDERKEEERAPAKRGTPPSVRVCQFCVCLCGRSVFVRHPSVGCMPVTAAVWLRKAKAAQKGKAKPAAAKKSKAGPPAVIVTASWPFTFEITSGAYESHQYPCKKRRYMCPCIRVAPHV